MRATSSCSTCPGLLGEAAGSCRQLVGVGRGCQGIACRPRRSEVDGGDSHTLVIVLREATKAMNSNTLHVWKRMDLRDIAMKPKLKCLS